MQNNPKPCESVNKKTFTHDIYDGPTKLCIPALLQTWFHLNSQKEDSRNQTLTVIWFCHGNDRGNIDAWISQQCSFSGCYVCPNDSNSSQCQWLPFSISVFLYFGSDILSLGLYTCNCAERRWCLQYKVCFTLRISYIDIFCSQFSDISWFNE